MRILGLLSMELTEISVGECPGSNSPEEFVTFSKPENTELQMVFHFHQ
jgi:hypothetical protein